MADRVGDLIATVEQGRTDLHRISEEESARRPAPGKWSPREILGHLVDSACNNHQRFVRSLLQEDLLCADYQQDAWVGLHRYQEAVWTDLIEFWRAYNLLLARVLSGVSEGELKQPRSPQTLRLADPGLEGEATTLELLLGGYLGHMKHHLTQILSPR